MELSELSSVVDGYLVNKTSKIKLKSFKIDSRDLKKGDVFIALNGKYKDGHDYISNSLKCSCVISEKDIDNLSIPIIKVDSTYDALVKIVNYIRNKYRVPLIAITGSNGKTTLKELISSILSNKYKVLKNIENKNNILGISDTLFNLNSSYDIGVIEMGMNHKGEISLLSKMCEPDVGIITNIGSSHIGNLGSKKDIFKAKYEIVDGIKDMVIVNGDDRYLKKVNAYKCGMSSDNDLIAYNIHLYKDYLTFNIYLDKEYEVVFNKPVKDYINSILIAIKVGYIYNIDIIDILDCIKNFKAVDSRLNMIKTDNFTIIDDSYNASYESLKCGIEYLKNIDNDKIIILGDMLELGKFAKRYHKKINQLLFCLDNKKVLTVGNYTKYVCSKHFNSNKDLINYLSKIELKKKYIYIKGSHAMNLNEIVVYLKQLSCKNK